MLFQSVEFIYIFLPIACAIYITLQINTFQTPSKIWIIAVSLAFYAWWYPPNLILILISMGVNYALGTVVGTPMFSTHRHQTQKIFLTIGVTLNLMGLAYFKYWFFIVENVSLINGHSYSVSKIVLPLAISFFTFQQIAFLIDRYRSHILMPSVIDYFFFVTFFPQLIAGPIVLAKEIFPQLDKVHWKKPSWLDLSTGLTLFTLGVFKKVFFGDSFGELADLSFGAATTEPQLLIISWVGVLAFSLQIYFDFSGYSDMAVGLARMMGIAIPFNFNSPYKATSIIEFWRRWHVTLSRFLRDYLYIPMGGNRSGPVRRYLHLAVVMLLGGLWHGAGWVFVIWGGIHGLSLIINHLWRNWRKAKNIPVFFGEKALYGLLTANVVVFAWVFFRAGSLEVAIHVLEGMSGKGGVLVLPTHYAGYFGGLTPFLHSAGVEFAYTADTLYFNQLKTFALIPVGILVVVFLPNSQEYLRRYLDGGETASHLHRHDKPLPNVLQKLMSLLVWRPNAIWGSACAAALIWVTLQAYTVKSFVYFEF